MDGLPPSPEQALEAAGAIVTRFVPKPVGRFQVRSFNQCRVDHASRYLIKGILAPRDFGLIFGQPGCGKSLVGPLLCHAVAEGRRVFGRRTRKSRVLYIAAEAGADMEVRFCAMRERYGDVEGLDLIAVPIDLQDQNSGDLEYLLAEIARLKPDLIVVDTIAAAFPGLEENEARDMGRAVRILRSLTEPSGAAVLAIHHAPKEGNTPRGWGGLNGDADVTMRVEGQDDQPRSVTFGKNRNGPSGHAFTFGLELVELGEDQDGDPIRRPVAVELDEEDRQKPRGKPLNDNQMGWLRDLQSLFATPDLAVIRAPAPDARGVPTLTRDQLRVGLREAGRFELDRNGNLTEKDRGKLRDMLNALKDKGKIGLSADLVWLL
ncbi:helicase RepA family protein [Roseomonas gilardii subsp. gilardii]|uniref:AAA family ATPase n=1 Tax=Roseomonas gilardii TaxID=257708 RepID=UPI001FF94688|nr:AAA family ATPase [Roseomonas gilardii]UPG72895.1 helicase RepA family protein [Roseomonas gilardii subsp. gilardii]